MRDAFSEYEKLQIPYHTYTRDAPSLARGLILAVAADKPEAKSGVIRSEGDLFLNGALACLLTGVGDEHVFQPSEYYPMWTMEAPSDSLKEVLKICTGWQSIARPADLMVAT
ncbi:hypothetical protein Pint_06190 [Pistacia integerrima]|uniref:Uncharacterized protein n=1 Tax=Pistacia integerrima TaxID=434235 RepID=A0ACC0Z6R2_9ROSI|nr:hypothetical protein Pint_06190 [Pistacia integerrima]